MRTVMLSNGREIPALGLGTWHMGEQSRSRGAEVKALQAGLDFGLSLIDTAEMYAEGGAEEVVGEAMAGRRTSVYLVSKVYPHNASRSGVQVACERSLKRLKSETIDLYLLHWRGQYPLAETVEGFEQLKRDGKIGDWGVSNFDVGDMSELMRVAGGAGCMSNQVLYHLGERGIEWKLLPDCQKSKIMVMAYSPLGQAEILEDEMLGEIAAKHSVSSAAIALAWVLRQPGVVAIPKAGNVVHVEENAQALTITLDDEDLAALDVAFPPPTGQQPLAML